MTDQARATQSTRTQAIRMWLKISTLRKELEKIKSEIKKLINVAEDPETEKEVLLEIKEQVKVRRDRQKELNDEIASIKKEMFRMLLKNAAPDLVHSVLLNLGVNSDDLYGGLYAWRYLENLVKELKKREDDLYLPLLREKKETEGLISNEFWRIYEFAVNKYYYADELDSDTRNVLRLYLRFGLFSTHESVISDQTFREIVDTFGKQSKSHINDKIFFLDEYFNNILRGSKLPPSYDDEFERQGKRSKGPLREAWMFERTFRYLRVNIKDYESMQEKSKSLPGEIQEAEKELVRVQEQAKDIKRDPEERRKLERKVTDQKRHIHELNRLLDKLKPSMKDKLSEIEEFKNKVAKLTKGCNVPNIMQREVNLINTAVRVCAKDSSPLNFFRSRSFAGSASMVTPEMVNEVVKEALNIDPYIFARQPRLYHQVLSETFTRPDRPIVIIGLPTMGERGFAAFGADDRGEGMIFLPRFLNQPRKAIIRVLGHYRWQTAVNDAGLDWQTFPNLRQEFDEWWRHRKSEYKRMQERHDPKLKDTEEPEKMDVKEFIRQYTYFIERQGTQWWTRDENLKKIFQRYVTRTIKKRRSL